MYSWFTYEKKVIFQFAMFYTLPEGIVNGIYYDFMGFSRGFTDLLWLHWIYHLVI